MEPLADDLRWDKQTLHDPHAAADKRRRVQRMFAAIAPSYDLNNRLHSLWRDQAWRAKAVRLAKLQPADTIVDVACGTGDLTLQFARAMNPSKPTIAWGVDYTFEMLPLACEKYQRLRSTGSLAACRFINGDAQSLPLPDACCDVASIAFGIRNVVDPAAALREFRRILRPGGRVIILEFSLPANPLLRGLYNFYFRHILPRTATFISGDRTGAYKYLPQSVNTFIGREKMLEMMKTAGFDRAEQFPMTFGVCVCYRGIISP